MEYIFSYSEETNEEFLTTVGDDVQELTGEQVYTEKQKDCTVTLEFEIVKKLSEGKNEQGQNQIVYAISLMSKTVQHKNALNIAEQNKADISYLSMMSSIDFPKASSDTAIALMCTNIYSSHYEEVKQYYEDGLWNSAMVQNAVDRWITKEESDMILNGGV